MRWIVVIFLYAVLSSSQAEPDPKKYKPESSIKPTQSPTTNTSLTDEERQFLREVEEKFGIKNDVLKETKKNVEEKNKTETEDGKIKPPFPAIIAIEIVNDTETKSKNGKRTIDANLGYGYKTNSGYAYSYLGRPGQEKGKFMIYPYSQEDIPPALPGHYQSQQSSGHSSYTTSSSNVEIRPSNAYELIEMQNEPQSYQYNKPHLQLNYDSIKALNTPPAYTPLSHHTQQPIQTFTPTTLYTTYNGEQLSGLSGQFPKVMPNYFMDPSQLLKYSQFQSAGLSQDHLRLSGSPVHQKVVPVLVLRIPSSYLKNPTAELYPNLPQNYPHSQYLNHVNLQELVNNYFKKIGFSFAPQVMSYQSPHLTDHIQAPVSTPVTEYEPQQYAAPYIQQPSYTQSDYSGVQYSAVKPVMAKYPLSYSRPLYYIPSTRLSHRQPAQKYQYMYQYVPKTASQQTYYIHEQAQPAQHEHASEQVAVSQQSHVQDSASQVEYMPQQEAHATPQASPVEYTTPETQSESLHGSSVQSVASQYDAPQVNTQRYEPPKEESVEYVSQQSAAEYGATRMNLPAVYTTSSQVSAQYELPRQGAHQDAFAVYPSQSGHIPRHYTPQDDAGAQSYYQKQVTSDTDNQNLVLTENYPSKDHTIATVLPYSYKKARPSMDSVQTVSYVTPMPFSSKYQSQYRIMVPQMSLKNPNSEKVSYVNSHSYSQSSQEQNPEAEYTVPSHHVPPIGTQMPPAYPKNYHSQQKRMAKPDPKSEARSPSNTAAKKKPERTENKNS